MKLQIPCSQVVFPSAMTPVRGRIWHCTDCRSSVTVPYEEPATVPLSQYECDRQTRLSEIYRQPCADPYQDGFFLHVEARCPTCAMASPLPGNESAAELEQRLAPAGKILEEFEGRMQPIVNAAVERWLTQTAAPDHLEALDPKTFTQTLGRLPSADTAAKRNGLVKQFLNRSRDALLNDLFRTLQTDLALDQEQRQLQSRMEKLLHPLRKEWRKYTGQVESEVYTHEEDVFSDGLVSITLRPTHDVPEAVFYVPQEISRQIFKAYLSQYASAHPWSVDEDAVLLELRRKILDKISAEEKGN